MRVTAHIDYVAVTFPVTFDKNELREFVGDWKEYGSGPHGYQAKHVSKNGAWCYSKGTMQMGVHVVMTGEVLALIRDTVTTDEELFHWIRSKSGKYSRVDLTVNIHDGLTTVSDLWKLWEEKQVRAQVKKAKRFLSLPDEGTDDGFYLGERTSDQFLRIYNKALKHGLTGSWIRIELQANKKKAKIYGPLLDETNDHRPIIQAAIKKFATFFNEEYLKALEDPDVQIPVSHRPEPAFYKWLRKQVAPALIAREREFEGEDPFAQLEAMCDEIRKQQTLPTERG
jgi:DNA relaxase NicK